MAVQRFCEPLKWVITAGSAIANTVTETIVFPNFTLPGSFLDNDKSQTLLVKAYGALSTTATPTIQFRLRWGGVAGTVIAATPAITTGSGVTNACWSLEALVQMRTSGATGTVFVQGDVSVNTASTPTAVQAVFGSAGWSVPAAVTVDLTADTLFSLTAQWSAASASNTLTGHLYLVEATT